MAIDTSAKGRDYSEAAVKEPGAPLGLESMQAGSDMPILVVEEPMVHSADSNDAERRRRANRRIAWTLLLLCAIFFSGIIASRVSGDSRIGLITLGVAITLFLVVAIGSSLRE